MKTAQTILILSAAILMANQAVYAQDSLHIKPGTYLAQISSPKTISKSIFIDSNMLITNTSYYYGDGIFAGSGIKGQIIVSQNEFVIQIDSVLCQECKGIQDLYDITVRGSKLSSAQYCYCPTKKRNSVFEYSIVGQVPVIIYQNSCYAWIECPIADFNCELLYNRSIRDSILTEVCHNK